MDRLRELLEAIRKGGVAQGNLRGLLHVLVGRRITLPDGTVVSQGLTWRELAALLKRLRAVPDDVGTVLMIGHNEGLWHFAVGLADDGKAGPLSALQAKLPTGALVALSAPIKRWRDLAPASATLVAFVRPRDLEGD